MLRIATFRRDCTPPAECSTGFGDGEPVKGIRDPLYLRGYVLDDGTTRCLVATLDYCGLMNAAYEEMRAALAEAVAADADRVVIHCIHQHDAPIIDFEIEEILGCTTYPRGWWGETIGGCAEAAAEAVDRLGPVASVGHAETRLCGYASNRRVLGDDGRVRGTRYSRCGEADLVAAPIGVIDPMLRTLAFRDPKGDTVASMNFYATHPQVSNGRGLYSADAPGEAIRLLDEELPGGFHGFLTGAGGNVTAGKYSSVTDLEGNLKNFGARLAAGISRNLSSLLWGDGTAMEWTSSAFTFPRWEERISRAVGEAADPQGAESSRLRGAVVASAAAYPGNREYVLRCLDLGSSAVLFLSGEPFVEYQLMAQSQRPDSFVATAANCSDGHLYLPLERSYGEGGYEVESFAWCAPEFEAKFRGSVGELLI